MRNCFARKIKLKGSTLVQKTDFAAAAGCQHPSTKRLCALTFEVIYQVHNHRRKEDTPGPPFGMPAPRSCFLLHGTVSRLSVPYTCNRWPRWRGQCLYRKERHMESPIDAWWRKRRTTAQDYQPRDRTLRPHLALPPPPTLANGSAGRKCAPQPWYPTPWQCRDGARALRRR